MKVISEKIINNLINSFNFKDINAKKLEDTNLRSYLTYTHFLDSERHNILETNSMFSAEDLHYSRYYWFIKYKNRYLELYGHDEGPEQQAFKVLEDIDMYLDNGIDWIIVECIEKGTI